MTELIDELRTAMAEWDSGPSTQDASRCSAAADWAKVLLPLVRDAAGEAATVLDFGCGSGLLSRLLAADGHRVTGVDASAGLLEIARGNAEQAELDIEWVHNDAEQPPAGPFDVVVTRNLLWTLPDRVSALRAVREVLRPGGLLVISDALWGGAEQELLTLDRFNTAYGASARQLPIATGLNRAASTVLASRAGFTEITDQTGRFDEAPYPDAPGFFLLTAKRPLGG